MVLRHTRAVSSIGRLEGHVLPEDTDHNLVMAESLPHNGPVPQHVVSSGMKLGGASVAAGACTGPGHPRTANPRLNPPRFRLANDGAVAEP